MRKKNAKAGILILKKKYTFSIPLQVAILFTDIIGFTKISEKMDPKEVLKLLSKYQTLMVDAIFRHGGSVDKFIGDAVMANFGTPKSSDNDAQNAFNCALTMNKKLRVESR